ncbi:cation transporter, partial [Candidatus Aerophobetes bacterium]|nr:cation transporter [Candidatus Aerophobetes bacterium]
KHPYGHEKIETLITLVLGFFLIAVGIKIGYDGIRRIFQSPSQSPTLLALFAALLSLVVKEIIYRYTLATGKKIKSTAILANAWHHRSDAFSSFVALIGIGGSMLGIKILDPLCAAFLAFFIVHMGIKVTKSTSLELIESSVDKELTRKMEKIALLVPGVSGVHGIRARQIGSSVFAEIHIEVAKKMNVEDGHLIADEVERKIIENINDVKEVLVHVDPLMDENKETKDTGEDKK